MIGYKALYLQLKEAVALYDKALMPILREHLTTSCEDEATQYLDFPDGLRLVFREGTYAGWYLPGEGGDDDAAE